MRMEDEQEDVATQKLHRVAYLQKAILSLAKGKGISSKTPERFDELMPFIFFFPAPVAELLDSVEKSRDGLTPEMRAVKKMKAERLKPFRDMIRQNKLLMEQVKASMEKTPVHRARGKKTLSPSSTKAAKCAPRTVSLARELEREISVRVRRPVQPQSKEKKDDKRL